MTPSTPGLRFAAARIRLGLTQTEAARLAVTYQTHISAFEGGRKGIGLGTLHAWCVALGIDPHEVDERLAPSILSEVRDPIRSRVAHPDAIIRA